MNLKLGLFKVIPLITIVAGVLASAEMANAGGEAKDGHGAAPFSATEATADGHGGGDHSGEEVTLSPEAQQLEFFAFLGAIGFSLIIPELLYRPKDPTDQNIASFEPNYTQPSQTQVQASAQYEAQRAQQPSDSSNVTRAEFVPHNQVSEYREPASGSYETRRVRQNAPILTFETTEDDFEAYTVPEKRSI